MKRLFTPLLVTAALCTGVVSPLSFAVGAGSDPLTITVQANQPGAKISPAMWGIFFEDINLGADGGLYAELVKNRAFEFPDPMMGWFKISPSLAKGELSVRDQDPASAASPHYLHLQSEGTAPFGVCNEGFRGMGVRAGEAYDFSVKVRSSGGSPRLSVELVGSDGTTLAAVTLESIDATWKPIKVTLRPKDTDTKARLNLILDGKGAVDVDQVSLFPQKTWKNRPGGLRADMVQMLADLKPGFLRFPGGCIVEGIYLDGRYQWKTTIGPVEERKLILNRWNREFKHRPTPDYYQSFGLGFFEYFQLCEDIGAAPLPILNCGMACEFNSNELAPLSELGTYIQDALDLIEFANGPVTSTWGAKRAALGHPAPFKLKLLGIGNEQWGPQYIERLALFIQALKAKHPEVQLVCSAGPSPADDRFTFLWPRLRELKVDITDEHCYANPIWFFSSAHRYDNYDRQGPKVFFGEYAAQSVAIVSTKNRNNLECALSEAAFMTGMERNAEVVRLASYAPLFAHVEGWQWTPNLIWTDNLRVYGTPNYYVQQLFSRNRGDVVLPVKLDGAETPAIAGGGIGLGTYQSSAEFKDVRVVRGGKTLLNADFASGLTGWTSEPGGWTAKDGVLQQTDTKVTTWAWGGDYSWTDYTLTLKARKLAGNEGFLVAVRRSEPNTRVQWNVGGWGNRQHGVQAILGEQEQIVAQVPGSIETGRWYDVRIELKGSKLDCFLDGHLVQSAEVPAPHVDRLYASAVRDEQAGEIILKVVNPGAAATEARIDLAGLAKVESPAKAIVLAGANLSDVNSLDEPRKLFPVESTVKVSRPRFTHRFAPQSMTVLRIKTR